MLVAILSSLSRLSAWAAGYSAAQVWYTAASHVLGSEESRGYDTFVTVAQDGTLAGTLDDMEVPFAVLFTLLFNVLLVAALVGLVRVQIRIHTDEWKKLGRPPPTGGVVLYVRALDAFADGVTFFAANILFVVLLSVCFWEQRPGDPYQLLYVATLVAVAAVVFGLATSAEFGALLVLRRCGKLTATAKKQAQIVNDWYVGQWAWLLGYLLWIPLWVLLTDAYLGVYEQTWTWFAMTGVSLCLWAVGRCVVGGGAKAAAPSPEEPTEETPMLSQRSGGIAWGAREKLRKLLLSALRWQAAVGAYFSLKQMIPTMNAALGMQDVNRLHLVVVTVVWTAVALAVSVFIDREEERKIADSDAAPHSPALTAAGRYARDLFQPIRLLISYLTGKVWLSFAFGVYGPSDGACFCWGYYSVLTLVTSSFSALFAFLDAKREFIQGGYKEEYPCACVEQHTHGSLCACVLCAADAYEEEYRREDVLLEEEEAGD